MNQNKIVEIVDKPIPFWSGYLFKDGNFKWSAIPTLLPFINLVNDLIFDSSTPSPESAKALLDILGLLNALLLASETGILSSVTRSDLEEVDKKFGNATDNGYGTYWKNEYKGFENGIYVAPSSYLYYRVGLAICLLFLSVLMVVYVFADMAGKNSNVSGDEVEEEILLGALMSEDKKFYLFKRIKTIIERDKNQCLEWFPCYPGDTPKRLEQVEYNDIQKDFDEMKAKVNKLKDLQLFCSWWKYARFAVLLILCTTVGGCSLCIYSLTIILLVKYPDHFVENNGYVVSTSGQCPIGMVEYYFVGISFLCFVLTLAFCGAGTTNAAYFTYKIDERKKWLLEVKQLQNEINTSSEIPIKMDNDNGMEKIVSQKMIARTYSNKVAVQNNNKTLPADVYSIDDVNEY